MRKDTTMQQLTNKIFKHIVDTIGININKNHINKLIETGGRGKSYLMIEAESGSFLYCPTVGMIAVVSRNVKANHSWPIPE